MSRDIDYGNLMHDAMRGLIKTVLTDVRSNGLPGAHHFFITFDTSHPDAELADWLFDRYPSEMTVVIQHQFEGLEVTDEGFGITLSFGDSPEPLYVPYNAIKTFVDPSVEFGLRFENQDGADQDEEDGDLEQITSLPLDKVTEDLDEAKPTPKEAEVVSLDSFRK